MKVLLRNQGREVEVSGRRRVRELLAELGVLPETVLVIRGRDLLTIDEVVTEDDVVELRPVISGGGREVPEVRRPRRAGAPAPQHGLLQARLPRLLPASRPGDHPPLADGHARRAGAGGGVGWKGLARALGRAPRRRLSHHRTLPGPGDLRLLAGLEGPLRGVRCRAGAGPSRGGGGRRGGRLDSRRARRDPAPDLLRLRAVQALPPEPRGAGGWVPGGGDRAQPRRRGGDAARLDPALGRVVAGPANASPRGHASEARAPGEAALPDERA